MAVETTSARTTLERHHRRHAQLAHCRPARRTIDTTLEAIWRSPWWAATAALPALGLVLLVLRYGVDLPLDEQWSLTALVSDLYRRELDLGDLWRLQDGHRPLVPRLLLLAAALLTHWNIRVELLLSVLFAAGVAGVLVCCLLREPGLGELRLRHRRGLAPLLSIVVLSLTQVDNWTWGWQLRVFLGLFAFVLGVSVLLGPIEQRRRLVVAMILGWIASYSFTVGLVYWVVLFPLAARSGPWREPRRTLWLSSAATCWLSFVPLAGETAPPLVWSPVRLVSFVLAALGAPVFPHSVTAARLAGAAGGALFVYLGLRLLGRTPESSARPWLVAWLAVGSYAAGGTLLVALGRAHLGAERALNGATLTLGALFWTSVAVLALRWSENGDQPELARRHWVVAGLLLATALFAARSLGEAHRFAEQQRLRREAREALLDDPTRPELSRLHDDTNVVRRARFILERYELSCFREREPHRAD